MTTNDQVQAAEYLALADDYEAGTAKALASGYTEYGEQFKRQQKMVVDALRLAASRATPARRA